MHTMIVLVLQAAVGALRLDGDNSPLTTCMAFVLSYPGAKYLSKFSRKSQFRAACTGSLTVLAVWVAATVSLQTTDCTSTSYFTPRVLDLQRLKGLAVPRDNVPEIHVRLFPALHTTASFKVGRAYVAE